MDPRLKLLLEQGYFTDEVALLIRLHQPDHYPAGVRVVAQFGDVISARVPRGQIRAVYDAPETRSIKAPRVIPATRLATITEERSDTNSQQVNGPNRAIHHTPFTGQGVVLGVVDWGFDFTHQNFRHLDGSTRFQAIWIQQMAYDGQNGFGYGTVFSADQINAALATDTPFKTLGYHPGQSDFAGLGMHGTHVLDIAAGNGRVGEAGIAPQTTLLAVEMGHNWVNGSDLSLGDSVKLVDGLAFLDQQAGERPMAVNLSMGGHGDAHMGKTLVEIAIDNWLSGRRGRAVVQSAGNYYAARIHHHGRILSDKPYRLDWQVRLHDPTPNELEIWYAGTDAFQATLLTPEGQVVGVSEPFCDVDLILNGQRVGRLFHRQNEPNTGLNQIDVILDNGLPAGNWELQLRGQELTNGWFHAWIERDDAGQSRFSTDQATATFTTNSICNGQYSLSVGAYDQRQSSRLLLPFSSSGPTVDGRTKPDLTAPGAAILAARSATPTELASTDGLCRKSGSSMAAPQVAGAVALLMERLVTTLPSIQVLRQMILNNCDPPWLVMATSPWRYGCGYLNIDRLLGWPAPVILNRPVDMTDFKTLRRPVRPTDTEPTTVAVPQPSLVMEMIPPAPTLTESLFDWASNAPQPGEAADFTEQLIYLSEDKLAFVDNQLSLGETLYQHLNPNYSEFFSEVLDERFQCLGKPREAIVGELQPGDIILHHVYPLRLTFQSLLADPRLYQSSDLQNLGWSADSDRPGQYARVVERFPAYHPQHMNFCRRLTDGNGYLLNGVYIIRHRSPRGRLPNDAPTENDGSLAAPEPPVPSALSGGALRASVGRGGVNNPDDVRLVQQLLQGVGYPISATGEVDEITQASILDYQQTVVGLRPPDGRIDPGRRTWQALKAGRPSGGSTSDTGLRASVGRGGVNNQDDVRLVQQLLQGVGYSITITGMVDEITQASILDYQQTVVGLQPPDGRIDPGRRTWQALKTGRHRNGSTPVTPVNPPLPGSSTGIGEEIARIARTYLGIRDIDRPQQPNSGFDNAEFERKMKQFGLWFTGAEWCGCFVRTVWWEAYQNFGDQTTIDRILGNSINARGYKVTRGTWETFLFFLRDASLRGQVIRMTGGRTLELPNNLGSVVVGGRPERTPTKGSLFILHGEPPRRIRHVGLVTEVFDNGTVEVIDGNHSNQVSQGIMRLDNDRLLGFIEPLPVLGGQPTPIPVPPIPGGNGGNPVTPPNPPTPGVTSLDTASFRNTTDIDEFFRQTKGMDFIDWFNANVGRRGHWASIRMNATSAGKTRFTQFWDSIPLVFGTDSINSAQFLSLQSIINNETGGEFSPRGEGGSLAYMFGTNPDPGTQRARKQSYNKSPNRKAGDLFSDPVFNATHGQKPPGSQLMNTTDPVWNGSVFPSGQIPPRPDPTVNGYVMEVDFYKFRGRGFIQTTWRDAYKNLISFVQQYRGPSAVINQYAQAWRGQTTDTIATLSSNVDWDALFGEMAFAAKAVGIFNRQGGNFLGRVQPNDWASIREVAQHIAGRNAHAYHELFENRVRQIVTAFG